jgi:uracil-DNA glycosylase
VSDKRPPAPVPDTDDLAALREAARSCAACDLVETGTQVVFGEGRPRSLLMMIGEQPGDMEDRSGVPFVGPAGRILDQALEAAGIERREVYVTNAVKHFKWVPRGKRRVHSKPNGREVAACRPWLEAEIDAVRPRLMVCLGATAAQALLGSGFRVTQHRGEIVTDALGRPIVATVHPSSILRAPDEPSRRTAMDDFIDDLRAVAGALRALS